MFTIFKMLQSLVKFSITFKMYILITMLQSSVNVYDIQNASKFSKYLQSSQCSHKEVVSTGKDTMPYLACTHFDDHVNHES